MFRPFGLFRNIACPQRASCNLQNCFFSHQIAAAGQSVKDSAPLVTKSHAISSENEGSPTPPPPKRRKIDDSEHSKSTEVDSKARKPTLKSILKKPTAGSSSSSSSATVTPSTTSTKDTPTTTTSKPPTDDSSDSDNGRYISVETIDKKTGMKSRTRIERGGAINLVSKAQTPTSSRSVAQSVRALHTTPTQKNTLAPKGDVTAELLNWGSSNPSKSTPSKPLEPERLVPRDVKKAPAQFEIRMNLLKALHGEYLRLDPSSQETVLGKQRAIKLARDEEETAAKDTKAYSVLMRNRIYALKKMQPAAFKKEMEAKLKAEKATAAEKQLESGLTPEDEARALSGYVHSDVVLKLYDYILMPPSDNEVAKAKDGVEAAKGEEACDRCQSRFQVLKSKDETTGLLTTAGSCTHHWGKAWATEKGGQRVWQCCQKPMGEVAGCVTAPEHVFTVRSSPRLASILQFVETSPAPADGSTSRANIEKAICLDCEMAYTTKGLELIRLTATRFPTYETVVDVLVKPFGDILDLNTRFSGVTPEQWATSPAYDPKKPTESSDVLTVMSSPLAARDLLLKHIDASTVIIGHALDNDLKSTRIIHRRVVDTCILYPHAKGMPYRMSLKYLVQKYLGRFIQLADSDKGHDSKEDANESGNLVRYKITQDVKAGKILKDGRWAGSQENATPAKPV